jgi:hypothetical protein
LEALELKVQCIKEGELQSQGGKKTEIRMREVKQILKTSGGSRTFKELEKSLGLSPSQFSKLLNHLDMSF